MLPTKGSLVLKRPLDKEARDVIEVTVTAVDHGTPSLQATTRVQVKEICKVYMPYKPFLLFIKVFLVKSYYST
jgi:hypothetical protein